MGIYSDQIQAAAITSTIIFIYAGIELVADM